MSDSDRRQLCPGLEFLNIPVLDTFKLYLQSSEEIDVSPLVLAQASPELFRVMKTLKKDEAGLDLSDYQDEAVRSMVNALYSGKEPVITFDYFRDILKLAIHWKIEWATDMCYSWFRKHVDSLTDVLQCGPLLKEACFVWERFSNMDPINYLTRRICYDLEGRWILSDMLCERYRSLSKIELKILLVCSRCDSDHSCVLLESLFSKLISEIAAGGFALCSNGKFLLENSCLDALPPEKVSILHRRLGSLLDNHRLLNQNDLLWLLDFRKHCLEENDHSCKFDYSRFYYFDKSVSEEYKFEWFLSSDDKFSVLSHFLFNLYASVDLVKVQDPVKRIVEIKKARSWNGVPSSVFPMFHDLSSQELFSEEGWQKFTFSNRSSQTVCYTDKTWPICLRDDLAGCSFEVADVKFKKVRRYGIAIKGALRAPADTSRGLGHFHEKRYKNRQILFERLQGSDNFSVWIENI
eukprot:sb/3464453/